MKAKEIKIGQEVYFTGTGNKITKGKVYAPEEKGYFYIKFKSKVSASDLWVLPPELIFPSKTELIFAEIKKTEKRLWHNVKEGVELQKKIAILRSKL